MKSRLHLQNATHMVEWSDNNGGMLQAKAFRSNHPAFKRRRIKRVLQVYPERVPCGDIIEMTCGETKGGKL